MNMVGLKWIFYSIYIFLFSHSQDAPQRRQHHYQSPTGVTRASADPYMSIYLPTVNMAALAPMQRNRPVGNAYGYGHR